MRDGETIVLGGLISDRKIHSISKVPGIGDIPILNWFFRQENPVSERVDLLIFLTARAEGAAKMTERDRKIFDKYRPHFKHVERIQDVPLHFEIPPEFEPPRPMFSDPPAEPVSDDGTDDMPVIMQPLDSSELVRAGGEVDVPGSDRVAVAPVAVAAETPHAAESKGDHVSGQTGSAGEAEASEDSRHLSHSRTEDEIKAMYDAFVDEQARLQGEIERQFGRPIDPASGPIDEADGRRTALSDESKGDG